MNFWEKGTIKRPVCAMLTENKIDIIFYSDLMFKSLKYSLKKLHSRLGNAKLKVKLKS